jgi:hypothetical protein
MALKEQEIVGFAGKEGMSISVRERISVHEGAMLHVHRIFRVLTVTVDKMMSFFFRFVSCAMRTCSGVIHELTALIFQGN